MGVGGGGGGMTRSDINLERALWRVGRLWSLLIRLVLRLMQKSRQETEVMRTQRTEVGVENRQRWLEGLDGWWIGGKRLQVTPHPGCARATVGRWRSLLSLGEKGRKKRCFGWRGWEDELLVGMYWVEGCGASKRRVQEGLEYMD